MVGCAATVSELGTEAFDRARRFLRNEARPLEGALFAYRFEDASAERVLEALAPYANDDGGFGNALEPDVRAPDSSALATGIALKTLEEVGCPVDHPLAARAVAWLDDTFDAETRVWRVVPEAANRHPHAPWWHDDGKGGLARTFGGFQVIPRAMLLAVLQRFRGRVALDLDALTEETVAMIESLEVLGAGGGSDLQYATALAQASDLPEDLRDRLVARIRTAIPNAVVLDRAQWSDYVITPLRAAPEPTAIGADLIATDLLDNLDVVIGQQTDNGCWEPPWNFPYPPAWAEAYDEWCAVITLETLTSLRAFGRC